MDAIEAAEKRSRSSQWKEVGECDPACHVISAGRAGAEG